MIVDSEWDFLDVECRWLFLMKMEIVETGRADRSVEDLVIVDCRADKPVRDVVILDVEEAFFLV